MLSFILTFLLVYIYFGSCFSCLEQLFCALDFGFMNGGCVLLLLPDIRNETLYNETLKFPFLLS